MDILKHHKYIHSRKCIISSSYEGGTEISKKMKYIDVARNSDQG